MSKETFAGDKKAPMQSPLAKIEKRFILANVKRVPKGLETYHLTLMTILWSGGMLVFGYLASCNIYWLWGSSAMIFLQWLTDCFDGAIGRHRDTGLIKWGFYMDHFLDFIFMGSLFGGYLFIVSDDKILWLLTIGFLYLALMASAWLDFAATNEFKITYLGLGPTEIRLLFVLLNTAMIIWGTSFFDQALPYLSGLFLISLIAIVYKTQRAIWKIDMDKKTASPS